MGRGGRLGNRKLHAQGARCWGGGREGVDGHLKREGFEVEVGPGA